MITMTKTIDIKTLQDIIDKVPLDNIDMFLVDLKNWFVMTKQIEDIKWLLPKGSVVHDTTTLNWINDGSHDADVQIDIL